MSTKSHVRFRRSGFSGSARALARLRFFFLPGTVTVSKAMSSSEGTSPGSADSVGRVLLVAAILVLAAVPHDVAGFESPASRARRKASSSECLNMAICSSVRVRFTPSS